MAGERETVYTCTYKKTEGNSVYPAGIVSSCFALVEGKPYGVTITSLPIRAEHIVGWVASATSDA